MNRTRMVTEKGSLHVIRCFNELFKVGQAVEFEGRPFRTWGPAGLGPKGIACVWLEGIELPVPLHLLTIPGFRVCSKAEADQAERADRQHTRTSKRQR